MKTALLYLGLAITNVVLLCIGLAAFCMPVFANDIRDLGTHNLEGAWIMYRVVAHDNHRDYERACLQAGHPRAKCEGGAGFASWTPLEWVQADNSRVFHCEVHIVRPGKRPSKTLPVLGEEAAHCVWGEFH